MPIGTSECLKQSAANWSIGRRSKSWILCTLLILLERLPLRTAAHTHAKCQARLIPQGHYRTPGTLFYASASYCSPSAASITHPERDSFPVRLNLYLQYSEVINNANAFSRLKCHVFANECPCAQLWMLCWWYEAVKELFFFVCVWCI